MGKCNLLTSAKGDTCKDKVKTGDTLECEAYQSVATIQTLFFHQAYSVLSTVMNGELIISTGQKWVIQV